MKPGATVGILGGGQLGRMLTYEAHRLGLRTCVLDPTPDGPAGSVADQFVQGAWTDAQKALDVAKQSDVVTVETEHIPYTSLEGVEEIAPLHPASGVLRTIQDRLRQKRFLAEHGFPQPAFAHVTDEKSLAAAVRDVGAPAVLKTLTGGYDGKGQSRAMRADEAGAAWAAIGRTPCIWEAFVAFEREVSVVLARGRDGSVAFYPLAENEHRQGILHVTRVPARAPPGAEAEAQKVAAGIAAALDHVGVMAVEMFLTREGKLLVNEIAPRVHNSGHYTYGACATSQFEQHLRAILGLPLGDTRLLSPCAMLNVLGDSWANGEPDWDAVLATPGAALHLYGKAKAAPGRKMGHIVVTAPTADEAHARAEALHARLRPGA